MDNRKIKTINTHALNTDDSDSLPRVVRQIKQCTVCAHTLPFPPKPILSVDQEASILIIGQAPGTRVHQTEIPWNDPSGDRLRKWLDIDKASFYDHRLVAIMPMGFCYPGKGSSGDLPPSKQCAPTWHPLITQHLKKIQLILLIGAYAQKYYLPQRPNTLTDTVRQFQSIEEPFFPLPHPSPRNQLWLKRNPWFEQQVLPHLRQRVRRFIHR